MGVERGCESYWKRGYRDVKTSVGKLFCLAWLLCDCE